MVEVQQTAAFSEWLTHLRDRTAAAIIASRIIRVKNGLLGDVKSVGDGVSELRINHGPGYRVYLTKRDGRIVILLCGGDKATQARDIKKAKEMAGQL